MITHIIIIIKKLLQCQYPWKDSNSVEHRVQGLGNEWSHGNSMMENFSTIDWMQWKLRSDKQVRKKSINNPFTILISFWSTCDQPLNDHCPCIYYGANVKLAHGADCKSNLLTYIKLKTSISWNFSLMSTTDSWWSLIDWSWKHSSATHFVTLPVSKWDLPILQP